MWFQEWLIKSQPTHLPTESHLLLFIQGFYLSTPVSFAPAIFPSLINYFP